MNKITFTKQRNTEDAHWEQKYGMAGFKSHATAGTGKNIDVYNGLPAQFDIIAHEAGHNFAYNTWKSVDPQELSEYRNAMGKEGPVSEYGAKAPREDFAESVRMYVEDPASFKKYYPKKYAAVKEMLS